MSKAVKKVGRFVGKVVKGVGKAIKKFSKSTVGKILIAAATVYFGGAAIMGAMGGASAGTGFLGTLSGAIQGAGAGISTAWSGLTGAASSLIAGEGLAGAGSSLSAGMTGAYSAGASAVGGAATAGGSALASTVGQTAATTGKVAANTTSPGLWASMGDRAQAAVISSGTQVAGGLIQGAGQQRALEEQRDYEEEKLAKERERYNQNVGTAWWGGSGNTGSTGAEQFGSPTAYAQPAPTGLVAGAMTPRQQYEEEMRARLNKYNPYAVDSNFA